MRTYSSSVNVFVVFDDILSDELPNGDEIYGQKEDKNAENDDSPPTGDFRVVVEEGHRFANQPQSEPLLSLFYFRRNVLVFLCVCLRITKESLPYSNIELRETVVKTSSRVRHSFN